MLPEQFVNRKKDTVTACTNAARAEFWWEVSCGYTQNSTKQTQDIQDCCSSSFCIVHDRVQTRMLLEKFSAQIMAQCQQTNAARAAV
jgi:hypothetical protein